VLHGHLLSQGLREVERFGTQGHVRADIAAYCGEVMDETNMTRKMSRFRMKTMCGDGVIRTLIPPITMDELREYLPQRYRLEERGHRTPCWIWVGGQKGGYGVMRFEGRPRTVSRLAWRAFVGEIPEGLEVCHKCDVPTCFRIDHLFLGTHYENMRDAAEKKRMGGLFGVEHHSAKLNPEKVRFLRAQFDNGIDPSDEMALKFGVSYNALKKIQHKQSWKSVT